MNKQQQAKEALQKLQTQDPGLAEDLILAWKWDGKTIDNPGHTIDEFIDFIEEMTDFEGLDWGE